MNLEELQAAYEQLQSENSALNERLSAALATIDSLQGDLSTAKAARDTYRKGYETQHAAHQSAQKIIADLRAQLEGRAAPNPA